MNALELLLQTDRSKLKLPTKKVEMKRLTAAAGTAVIFELEALDFNTYADIGEMSKNNADLEIYAILNGVKEPCLKDKKLCEKYGCVTPYELVKRLLLPGEITTLYNEISDLCGFDNDMVEEIKN
jgi:hypothetical protein